MQCDTSSCLCRFYFVGATFGPKEFITRNLKHLSYSTFVILILRKIFACLSGKLSTEFTSPITKSTSPGLSDMTFFAPCTYMYMQPLFNRELLTSNCQNLTSLKVHLTQKYFFCLNKSLHLLKVTKSGHHVP